MRRFLLAAFVVGSLTASAAEPRKNIVWQNHFDVALKLAQETGKPLLIDFWATWCGPCKRMDTQVWPDDRLAAVADRYIFAAVDVDHDKGTENRYLVHAIPTIVVADPWGHAVANHVGYTEAPVILSMMGQLPSDYSEAKEWFELLERDSKNTKALCRVGQFYADRHAFHISNGFLGDALKTPAAKEDDGLREDLTMAIAINQLRDGSLGDARKRLEQYLRLFPEGHRQDEALAALVAVQLKQGKRGDAEKSLRELQRRFPDSRGAATATALMAKAK